MNPGAPPDLRNEIESLAKETTILYKNCKRKMVQAGIKSKDPKERSCGEGHLKLSKTYHKLLVSQASIEYLTITKC